MCRPNEARGLLRELRLSEQLIQRKFAAPSFAYGANLTTTRALLAVGQGPEAFPHRSRSATSESNELCRP
jgi:hypothetical protein